jgi:hypothetical protein
MITTFTGIRSLSDSLGVSEVFVGMLVVIGVVVGSSVEMLVVVDMVCVVNRGVVNFCVGFCLSVLVKLTVVDVNVVFSAMVNWSRVHLGAVTCFINFRNHSTTLQSTGFSAKSNFSKAGHWSGVICMFCNLFVLSLSTLLMDVGITTTSVNMASLHITTPVSVTHRPVFPGQSPPLPPLTHTVSETQSATTSPTL